MFPQGSRGPDDGSSGLAGGTFNDSSGDGFLNRLRTGASPAVSLGLLHQVQERSTGRVLVVPSGFVRDQLADRFSAELRSRAAELGNDRVELVVDAALSNPEAAAVETGASWAESPSRRATQRPTS